ncbi:autotransporter domain-containing protein [uncultured Hoeflea sp.]|uniref:autotransporter outer membrane beta-barrel domain-containing protein n=1 Tax=uncultured Hoeflea sp. TaxID=538666 RepID=UPI0030DD764E
MAADIVGDQTVIGPDAPGSGTLGNPYSYGGELNIGGAAGNGSVTVTAGGTVSSAGRLSTYIGRFSGNEGAVTVSGTNSSWTTSADIYLGLSRATGTLTVSNGGAVTADYVSIGGLSGTGHVYLDGGSLSTTSRVTIGANGTGFLTLSGGSTLNVVSGTGTIRVAENVGDNGTLNIGAAAGDTAAAAGTINAANIRLRGSSSKIVFNHTGTDYMLDEDIFGDGTIEHYAGTTILTGANTNSGSTTIFGGTLQIGNGGTTGSFGGDITNNAALIFNRSDALTFVDDISGTGTLTKSGAGVLTLTGSNTHSGRTTVEAGTLRAGSAGAFAANTAYTVNGGTLDLNGHALTMSALSGTGGTVALGTAGLTVNQSGTTSYGGVISGTGSLTKSGAGTLTLTGANTHTGGTTVLAGRLVVNGSVGAVTLSGGSLGGSGTIGGFTASSGSTIAPGNSIGTLNVTGSAAFTAGSTYAVEVDSAGNSDKIAATGSVTIDNGATVSVSAENGTDDGATYAPSTTYTIITAGTAVTGEFGSVSENFAYLDAALGYGPKAVTLTLTRNASSFASIGRTANQRAVANGVSSLTAGNAVYDAVVGLSADRARMAFDSLSGEIHASTNGQLLEDSYFVRDSATTRMRARDRVSGTWAQAYGNWEQSRGDGNASEMNRLLGGAIFGADTALLNGWRAGILAGYRTASLLTDTAASEADADSYVLGAYASRQFGPLGVRLGTSYELHDVSTSRTAKAGGFSDQLTADYLAGTAQVFGEIGYTFETPLGQFVPFAGLSLVHQHSAGFREKGGAAALTASSTSHMLGVTTIGVRGIRQFAERDGLTAALTGGFEWRHVIGDASAESRMHLAGSDAFTISGTPVERDAFQLEAGLDLRFSKDLTLGLGYQGAFGSAVQSHGFIARLSGTF